MNRSCSWSFCRALFREKEVNTQEAERRGSEGREYRGKISHTKDFKYPPILPIVFYDGRDEWTASTNFFDRTEMNDIFGKYIPKFEYELVSLKEYSYEDLAEFGNMLSLVMILDKVKTAEEFRELGKLPIEYRKRLDSLKAPPHLKEILVKVFTVFLAKINVPEEEIDELVDLVDERGFSEMLAIEDYDIQETRRLAREEGRALERRRAEQAEWRAEQAEAEIERLRRELASLRVRGAN